MMPTLPSMAAQKVVINTICGATNDKKVGIIITLGFGKDTNFVVTASWHQPQNNVVLYSNSPVAKKLVSW